MNRANSAVHSSVRFSSSQPNLASAPLCALVVPWFNHSVFSVSLWQNCEVTGTRAASISAPCASSHGGSFRSRPSVAASSSAVINEVIVEVDGLLDEPQAERAEAEIQVGLRGADGRGDVMEADDRH